MEANQEKLLQEPGVKTEGRSDLITTTYMDIEKADTSKVQTKNFYFDDSHDYSVILKELLVGGIPSMIQIFSALFVNNTTIHFLGQKGDNLLLDGISMANNFLVGFSFYVIMHMNVGLTAASAQAYGARQKELVGLYLHRALIIHLMVGAVSYFFFFNSSYLFSFLEINPNMSQIAARFLVYSPFYILANIMFDTVKSYLYAHGIFNPQVVCQVFITTSYWLVLKYFFIESSLRELGIMIALTITQFTGALLLIIYVQIFRPVEVEETWFFFRKDSFEGIWSLFKVIFGIAIMGYVEVLAYRIQSFAALYLTEAQMTAFITFLTFDDLYYILPVGLAISMTSLIGRAVGSRDKEKIFRVIRVAFFVGVILLSALLIIFFFCHETFFNFYTKDPNVKDIMMQMGYIYYAFFVADFSQSIVAGILKGVGKEKAGTKAFVLCLYLVALPLSLFLAFNLKMHAVGLWLGITIGIYFVISSYLGIYITTNLDEQCDYVTKRIKETTQ